MSNISIEALQKALEAPKPLHSIFDRVEIKKHEFKPERRSRLDPVILTADGLANGFPKLSDADLQTDLKRLDYLRDSAHAETLPFLFQKYGWRIADPNDSEKYPDVAYCDAFRATQALAKPGPGGTYLLVKGDLTGIQDYIYHGIKPNRAGGLSNLTKRLRTRSILVSLLSDFVANVILRELGLISWHLLFAGGGHFNLLLPGDEETQAGLKIISESIDKSMREQFGDRLELIVAHANCGEEISTNPGKCFEAVNAERDRKKNQQHRKVLYDLFTEGVKKGKKKEIRIGGLFPRKHCLLEVVSKGPLKYFEPEDERDYRGDLVLAEFTVQSHHTLLAVTNWDEAEQFLLRNKAEKGKPENIQSALILALNKTDFLPKDNWASDFEFPVGFGFRFLGKNAPRPKPKDEQGREIEDAPEMEDEDPLDFNQIAQIGQEGQQKGEGFVRLGSLMLDVDNLGQIFSHGLKDATLGHVITLSREMNYFFTAHFNQRAVENDHRVYVVYSGGDDAFAVGKWDRLMRFTKILREDFQHFICYEQNQNDDVHFSAGLFMSNPHYPVGRFYKDTKAAQEKAKGEEGKNRMDVFGYTLGWSSYSDKVTLGDQLYWPLKIGVTNSGRKFSTSFAYRIMQLVKTSYYERGEWDNKEQTFHRRSVVKMERFARNVALMRNLFARNGFSEIEIQRIGDAYERELIQSFLRSFDFETPYKARDYLVAINFAMLQVRSNSKPPTHGQQCS